MLSLRVQPFCISLHFSFYNCFFTRRENRYAPPGTLFSIFRNLNRASLFRYISGRLTLRLRNVSFQIFLPKEMEIGEFDCPIFRAKQSVKQTVGTVLVSNRASHESQNAECNPPVVVASTSVFVPRRISRIRLPPPTFGPSFSRPRRPSSISSFLDQSPKWHSH